jgi:hypothetical protein
VSHIKKQRSEIGAETKFNSNQLLSLLNIVSTIKTPTENVVVLRRLSSVTMQYPTGENMKMKE